MNLFFPTLLAITTSLLLACQSKKKVIITRSSHPNYIGIGLDKKDCLSMNETECNAFTLINNVRENNNLKPLLAIENCILVARYNSEQMHALQNLSHEQKNESWVQRITRFDAIGTNMAENIAVSPHAQRLVDQWMNSKDHKKNILDPKFNVTGMGLHQNYWTQCFIEIPTDTLNQLLEKEKQTREENSKAEVKETQPQ